MPYGDLAKQTSQRFATMEDLVKHDCTVRNQNNEVVMTLRTLALFARRPLSEGPLPSGATTG